MEADSEIISKFTNFHLGPPNLLFSSPPLDGTFSMRNSAPIDGFSRIIHKNPDGTEKITNLDIFESITGAANLLNQNPIEQYVRSQQKQKINGSNSLGPSTILSSSSSTIVSSTGISAPKALQKSMTYPCRYDISMDFDVTQKRIGDGASCVVYEGVHRATGTPVAVKIIPQNFLLKEPNLISEIKILSQLNHSNIVNILAASVHKTQNVAIVMELLSGENLFDYLCEVKSFEEKEAKAIFKQILSAVSYMHEQGFIHRDIKAENVIFTDHTCTTVKLIDFGLATSSKQRNPNPSSTTSVGTLGYKSPEVLSKALYSESSDCWSLGVLLYVMLCGYPPFVSNQDDVGNEERLVNSPFWVLFNRETADLKKQISQSPVQFPHFSWSSISYNAQDLLSKLLSTDRSTRITASEALEHPWFSSLSAEAD